MRESKVWLIAGEAWKLGKLLYIESMSDSRLDSETGSMLGGDRIMLHRYSLYVVSVALEVLNADDSCFDKCLNRVLAVLKLLSGHC